MDLLGLSLEKVFESRNRQFSIKVISQLGCQMVGFSSSYINHIYINLGGIQNTPDSFISSKFTTKRTFLTNFSSLQTHTQLTSIHQLHKKNYIHRYVDAIMSHNDSLLNYLILICFFPFFINRDIKVSICWSDVLWLRTIGQLNANFLLTSLLFFWCPTFYSLIIS